MTDLARRRALERTSSPNWVVWVVRTFAAIGIICLVVAVGLTIWAVGFASNAEQTSGRVIDYTRSWDREDRQYEHRAIVEYLVDGQRYTTTVYIDRDNPQKYHIDL
ncbi:hypothetical protein QSJ18_06020 [Gordonia sp. ABSL1-1]|uniref:hypothetical protein n=1 Tax=Gordonia sp. ABSL1-1 TaxID=3053923 RepID=UPI0025746566|nr:hypothetical protein [Gordonia sp. ABSL1-1]MDL9936294.1 hypothetical protein [Gordonia sp. ABSL1-1]